MFEQIFSNNNLDELVFDSRNKEYGAYAMRKKYKRNVNIALSISLSIVMLCVGVKYIIAKTNTNVKNLGITEVTFVTTKMPIKEEVAPPPPPPANKSSILEKVSYTIPVVSDSEDAKDEMLSMDSLLVSNVATQTDGETHDNIVVHIPKPEIEEEFQKNFEVFNIEEQPTFPGGELEFRKYLAQNVVYPPVARENNIEGKVFVRFLVSKTGEIDKVSLLRGANPVLDEEALRVIQGLPKWTPGKHNGHPVNVWFTVPIVFELKR